MSRRTGGEAVTAAPRAAVTVHRGPTAVTIETEAAGAGLLPRAWLAHWRVAVVGAAQHPDDRIEDDGSGARVAARVRARRAGPLLDLAAAARTAAQARGERRTGSAEAEPAPTDRPRAE